MKRTTVAMNFCGTVSLVATASLANQSAKTGMTLTQDQLKCEPNPRVPGLSVARIISKGTESGP